MQVVDAVELTKAFAGGKKISVTLSVGRGTCAGLLGVNGAGKTTTIMMLMGLLLPTSGRALVCGRDPTTQRSAVGALTAFFSPYVDLPHRLTVEENLQVFGRLYGNINWKKTCRDVLDELDLGPLLRRKVGTLSSGERARTGLAKALLGFPELLFLDEPTASLDLISAKLVRAYLKRRQEETGLSILMTSHNVREVEDLCQEIHIMRNGQIAASGSLEKILRQSSTYYLEDAITSIVEEK